MEAILDISEKRQVSKKIKYLIIFDSYVAIVLFILYWIMFSKDRNEDFGYYTLCMLFVILLFIAFKFLIIRGILKRPVKQSKAIKTILEFSQAYIITISWIIGTLCVEDFYTS